MQCVCMSSRSSSLSSDPSVSNMATDKTHEMLEDENERLMDEMARKIDTLNTVSSIKTSYFFIVFVDVIIFSAFNRYWR